MRLAGSRSSDKSHEKYGTLIPFSFEPCEMGVAYPKSDSHKHGPGKIIHRIAVTVVCLPDDSLNLHRKCSQRKIPATDTYTHIDGFAEYEHRVNRHLHRLSAIR